MYSRLALKVLSISAGPQSRFSCLSFPSTRTIGVGLILGFLIVILQRSKQGAGKLSQLPRTYKNYISEHRHTSPSPKACCRAGPRAAWVRGMVTCSSSPRPFTMSFAPGTWSVLIQTNPALGKGPHPSWLCVHLPFALSTVELGGQLKAGGTQELPNFVGACRWAVEPQETCQAESRCSLRLCQDLARCPPHSCGSRQPTPKPTQQASPAGAIAMEKGRLGAVEQVELGFLGFDLVLTLVQAAKASTESVGTWGQMW